MSKIPYDLALQSWATAAVAEHARDMSKALGEKYGATRQSATAALKKLVADGWLTKSGAATRPVYANGTKRAVWLTQALPVEEDLVWNESVRPHLDLRPNVQQLASHCFTEILNNANDHSRGTAVRMLVIQDPESLIMGISDNGEGIFEHIYRELKLSHPSHAILELHKGKTTTDPANHTGQGIFFSSRMCDYFRIKSKGLEFLHQENAEHNFIRDVESSEWEAATSVIMIILMTTERTTKEVFDMFSTPEVDDSLGNGFYRTVVPVRMARFGTEDLLVSRSQAKRLCDGFEKFRKVVLDFERVDEIGQAFADQLFRVFARNHPEVELSYINAGEAVRRMIERAVSDRLGQPNLHPS